VQRLTDTHPSADSRSRPLARAYVLEVQHPAARVEYLDFFALWKDVDPDIPILKRAKAEYAKLQ
jgi:eukaryotic-like serine/threonine-protein kinase